MCRLENFKELELDEDHYKILRAELEDWHKWYLPVGKTVLDIGAGNGETAQFYLNHGAEHVICIEPDASLLYKNFGKDPRVTIIPMAIDSIKSDCEGGERGMVIETHFPFYLKYLGPGKFVNPDTTTWKLEPVRILEPLWRLRIDRLRQQYIQAAHFIRRGISHLVSRPRSQVHD